MKTRMTSFTLEPTLLRKKSNLFGGPPPTSPESSGRGRGGYDRPQRAMGGGS